MTEKIFVLHVEMEDMHSTKSKHKSKNRRKEKRLKCRYHFVPRKTHTGVEIVHDE